MLKSTGELRAVQRRGALIRRIAPRHFLPLSKAFLEARAVRRNLPKLSDEAKRIFLTNNKGVAVRILADQPIGKTPKRAGITWANQSFKDILKMSDHLALHQWAFATAATIENAERKNLRAIATKYIQQYLESKGRQVKTPVERQALGDTVSWLLEKTVIGRNPSRPLVLSMIRGVYFFQRMHLRMAEREKTKYLNSVFRELFGSERLTVNQRRAARQWLEENYKLLEQEKERLMAKILPEDEEALTEKHIEILSKEFKTAEQAFKEKTKEILAVFRGSEKKPAPMPAPPQPAIVKPGTRAERIAAHEAAEKMAAAQKATAGAAETKAPAEARPGGEKFNPTEFILGEIGKESGKTASFLRGLHSRGLITQGALSRLFTSGSLTQKVFRKVAEDRGFRAGFGGRELESLARGLAFIGPKGKQTERVRKAFQGEKGKQLFEFLEGNGFINTQHTQGLVTYLARI
jgi:hypothetical protein